MRGEQVFSGYRHPMSVDEIERHLTRVAAQRACNAAGGHGPRRQLARPGAGTDRPHGTANLLRTLARHRITHADVVPTIFMCLQALPEMERRRHDLSSLRFLLHAGGPCAPRLKPRINDGLGPAANECHGSIEAGPSTFCTSADAIARPGTVGHAALGVQIEIRDEQGRALPRDESGKIRKRQLRDDLWKEAGRRI